MVDQNPHQLRHRHRRMCVVELYRYLLRKGAPIGIVVPEPSHNIGKRAGDQKVLLHKAQALPQTGRVVGIEDSGEGFSPEPLCYGADEIAVAELLKVELVRSGGGPQS